jgi:hypothetical protein
LVQHLINNKNCPFLTDMTLEQEPNARGDSRQWAATGRANTRASATLRFKNLAAGQVVDYDR